MAIPDTHKYIVSCRTPEHNYMFYIIVILCVGRYVFLRNTNVVYTL